MDDMIFLKTICVNLNFGSLLSVPEKIMETDNYKTYRTNSEKGIYDIKIFDSRFIEENKNLEQSEILTEQLISNNIPIIAPLEINGEKLMHYEDKYFYVYPTIRGNVLLSKDVILEHCKTIGKVLGKIHGVTSREKEKTILPLIHIRWRKYLRIAEHKGSPITQLLAQNIKNLEHSSELYNNSLNRIPEIETIIIKNFGCNNVLWSGSNYTIINSELVQYGNPYIDLLNVALLWSGMEEYKVNFNLFNNVINEYFKELGYKPNIDWKTIYDAAYKERLREVEKDIKCALQIDCNDKELQSIAEKKIHDSIHNLVYYANLEEEIIKRLN